MDGKIAQFLNKGMRQDLSIDKVSNEYAFENINIRITESEDHTLLSVTNELGTRPISITNDLGQELNLFRVRLIGSCSIENYLVLFFARLIIPGQRPRPNDSLIIKIYIDEEMPEIPTIKWSTLYDGNLGFHWEHPIEALGDYESEDIIKVYWIDGVHQPRMINIMADPAEENYTDTSFDFLPKIYSFADIEIEKQFNTGGRFPSGVIQYAFNYSNIAGQESAVFYTSEIQYIMFEDRAAGPDEIVDCSFKIKITNLDDSFDRINIYSIYRASLDGTPITRKIDSLDISKASEIEPGVTGIVYTDSNNTGEIIDNTELFYKGGDYVIAGTLDQKDSVLFLGDLRINRQKVNDTIVDYLKDNYEIIPTSQSLPNEEPYGVYKYSQQDSSLYRYLKAGEYYRIGVQLQDIYGNWSTPIYLEDYYKDISERPGRTTGGRYIKKESIHINNIENFNTSFYKRIRPVIVFPRGADRSCYCQGVLNPTVFKLKDRYNNAPYAVSSWFFRPIPSSENYNADSFIEYRHGKLLKDSSSIYGEIQSQDNLASIAQTQLHNSNNFSYFTRQYATVGSGDYEVYQPLHNTLSPFETGSYEGTGYNIESPNILVNYALPNVYPSIFGAADSSYYAVDSNIVTLNSPDLENITEAALNVKLRIVGTIPINDSYSLFSLATETPSERAVNSGFWNLITSNGKHLSTYSQWIDLALYKYDSTWPMLQIPEGYRIGYPMYPWHKEGILTGSLATDNRNAGKIKRKILSNSLYSLDTRYFSFESSGSPIPRYEYDTVSKAYIYDPSSNPLIKINNPDSYNVINSSLLKDNGFYYYGSCDTITTPTYDTYMMYCHGSLSPYGNFRQMDFYSNLTDINKDGVLTRMDRITPPYTQELPEGEDPVYFYSSALRTLGGNPAWDSDIDIKYPTSPSQVFDNAPCHIKYKSTKHAVLSLGFTEYSLLSGGSIVLPQTNAVPTKYLDFNNIKKFGRGSSALGYPFWMNFNDNSDASVTDISNYMKSYPTEDIPTTQDYLYMGELYHDVNADNIFGGTSEYALSNNLWIPAGDVVNIEDCIDAGDSSIDMLITGDTMYQRWDCLKTYAYTNEDANSITETLSFNVESQINLDGRYDKNRGRGDNTSSSPENINLFNDVYNQKNNYFSYRILDDFYYRNTSFPNQFVWSLPKQPNAEIDSWTNITLSSVYNVDGSLGKINKIKRFNDTLFGFQDKGIFQILFNSRSQIATTTGIPIELANSGKVDGVRYLSTTEGCKNKWSICETPMGLYFIDDYNHNINNLSGNGLRHLSKEKGFDLYMRKTDTSNFYTYYDNILKDVYFVGESDCLCFSEKLDEFMSFYPDYSAVSGMFNFNNKLLAFKWLETGYTTPYEMHVNGTYNKFFDKTSSISSITYRVAPEPGLDKIFTEVEFDSEMFDSREDNLECTETFSKLYAKTDYQYGGIDLTRFPNLIRKFRKWRANIPRDTKFRMDRMRGPWATLCLEKTWDISTENSDDIYKKLEFHSLGVKYFV